jgi:hypothetical protein
MVSSRGDVVMPETLVFVSQNPNTIIYHMKRHKKLKFQYTGPQNRHKITET